MRSLLTVDCRALAGSIGIGMYRVECCSSVLVWYLWIFVRGRWGTM